MSERIGDLTNELAHSDDGCQIMLEQDSCGNIDRVEIHAIHVRHLAEKLGLTNLADPHAQRTIASLTRRIRVLADRIDSLHDHLMNFSDTRHADFTWEQTYSKATLDIADEFCADLDEAEVATVAATDVAQSTTDGQPVTPPVTQATRNVHALLTTQQQTLL